MGGCVYEVDCLVFYWISKDLKKVYDDLILRLIRWLLV